MENETLRQSDLGPLLPLLCLRVTFRFAFHPEVVPTYTCVTQVGVLGKLD